MAQIPQFSLGSQKPLGYLICDAPHIFKGGSVRLNATKLISSGVLLSWLTLLPISVQADTQWRMAPDVIFKSQWLSDTDPSGTWFSAGIDAYKAFTANGRTVATATVQLYEWCVDDRVRKPGVLSGTDDCELISKVSKVNFLVSGDGRFNIMVVTPNSRSAWKSPWRPTRLFDHS